jgi:membrane associated rhomboid family serine protease
VVMEILFDALILWSIGASLEASWGRSRLLWFAGTVPVVAGLVTLLASIGISSLRQQTLFGGASIVATSMWVAYGLSFGRQQTNFWGMPVTGNVFAGIGVLFVLLATIFYPWQMAVPEWIGLGLTFYYVKVGSPRWLWVRFQSWRLQRDLKSRSKHLKVLSNERNMPSDSDRYLH